MTSSSDPLALSAVPAVEVGMLIRRSPADVFAALADPALTTRFWYTRSSGPMVAGAQLTWEWEMHGVCSQIRVLAMEDERRIRFEWSGYRPEAPTTVEFRFIPWDGGTYVQATESGFTGTGDEVVGFAVASKGGFTFLLSSMKAFLEHGIELGLVADAFPKGLEL
jgi:uncharacterized protein YndB with AHSA1/START domain